MTPEERDRLVRVEEQIKNQREDFDEVKRELAEVLRELRQLRAAFNTVASFSKGGAWALTKVAVTIAGLIGLVATIADHWPFRQ